MSSFTLSSHLAVVSSQQQPKGFQIFLKYLLIQNSFLVTLSKDISAICYKMTAKNSQQYRFSVSKYIISIPIRPVVGTAMAY